MHLYFKVTAAMRESFHLVFFQTSKQQHRSECLVWAGGGEGEIQTQRVRHMRAYVCHICWVSQPPISVQD